MNTLETKSCSKCKEDKPLEKFAVYKNKPFSWCKPCQVISSTSYRKRNPEKAALIQRNYREKHPGMSSKRSKEWREKNPDKAREQNHNNWIKNKDKINARNRERGMNYYGITVSQYEKMLAIQYGVCAICSGVNKGGRRLSVDHDHETGQVRGLLCMKCNTGIGKLNDNPILIRKALAYLEDSNV